MLDASRSIGKQLFKSVKEQLQQSNLDEAMPDQNRRPAADPIAPILIDDSPPASQKKRGRGTGLSIPADELTDDGEYTPQKHSGSPNKGDKSSPTKGASGKRMKKAVAKEKEKEAKKQTHKLSHLINEVLKTIKPFKEDRQLYEKKKLMEE